MTSPVDQNNFLEQTLTLLRQSQSNDTKTQEQVSKQLEEWKLTPEFNYALICILCDPTSCDETTRSLSCLILKNTVRKHFLRFPPKLQEFMKEKSLELLKDPAPMIRAAAGILIVSIGSNLGFLSWPELLPSLGNMISMDNNDLVESAFNALFRLCEDLSFMFIQPDLSKTLQDMLPRFLDFFSHPNPKIRNYALLCVNQFLPLKAEAIMNILDKYIEALFMLANDNDCEVRKNVCHALVILYDLKPDVLSPHLPNVIQYMMERSKDEQEEIALEACEFWLSLPDNDHGKSVLRQYLPQLVPFFLQKMRHSPEDIEAMIAEMQDDYMIPDKIDDIKPRHYRSSRPNFGSNPTGDHVESNQDDSGELRDLDDTISSLGDEDDYDGPDDSGLGSSWNMRKCTATALDCFSNCYGDEILPFVFQELQVSLNHEDWVVKEAAVLAIGAVAEGSLNGMIPHLPTLIPYLVERLSDSHPMVRLITCWTISRYTSWIVQNPQERHFGIILKNLLRCILDNNKRVQEAACSSFATLAEGAGLGLVQHLDEILATLVQAFDKYQHKNLLNLYDAVGTLAEAVKQHLNQQKYTDILMPPIIRKWNSLNDTDIDLFPLLECISSVAVALCEGFKPHSEPVFRRCLSLVEQNLQQAIAFNLDPENTDMPNKDFMIAALDVLSGLAEGLKSDITDLVASSNIMDLTLPCMTDSLAGVRQSSFALLGDLTKACFSFVQPHIPRVMPLLALNLKFEDVSVCNNATWAIGEISVKIGSEIRQYIPMIVGQLLENINRMSTPRTLLDNTAITLGRLSYACPDDLAPHLKDFIKPWCSSVRTIKDNEAKDSAFRGVCELIRKNPNGVVNDFYYFCDAIACWEEPRPDLKQLFFDILHGFKNQVGEQSWSQFTQSFPIEVKEKLRTHYGV